MSPRGLRHPPWVRTPSLDGLGFPGEKNFTGKTVVRHSKSTGSSIIFYQVALECPSLAPSLEKSLFACNKMRADYT